MEDRKIMQEKEELGEWLQTNDINIQLWGKGSAKTLQNLWDEYRGGEVVFQDNPPQRLVHVVQVLIQHEGFFLVETEQEFGNGHRRSRMQPPSEKFKIGEDHIAVAYRCLKEELDIGFNQTQIINSEYQVWENFAQSPSYPGLMTRYMMHTVAVKVDGLPDADFWINNRSYGEGDPIKRHKWSWRPVSEFKASI